MTLAIRTEGTAQTGIGHVMRCVAVAQAWEDLGEDSVLGMRDCPEGVSERFASEHIRFVALKADGDKTALEELCAAAGQGWVIVDGYHFSSEELAAAKKVFGKLLVIHDGTEAPTGNPDLLVNANLYATAEDYLLALGAPTKLLLGPRYALLRREFRERAAQEAPDIAPRVRKILLSLGGSDPVGATGPLLEALAGIKDVEITAIVGPMNARRAELTELADELESVEIVSDPPDLSALVQEHDLAVSAAGTTTWELAALGVPAVFIAMVDNQVAVAESMQSKRAGISLGPWDAKTTPDLCRKEVEALVGSPSRREILRDRARALVDGQGASRVARAVRFADWSIVPVAESDREEVWKLSSDETVRKESLNRDPIPWETHVKWFARAMANDRFLILRDVAGVFSGQARVGQSAAGEQVISISLAPGARGKGVGTYLIEALSDEFLRDHPNETLIAYIRTDNEASMRAFQKAGYRVTGAQKDVARLCLHIFPNK